MNTITTRTASAGARFSPPSTARLATIDAMVARAAAFGIGGRMAASVTNVAPADPASASPSTPADTPARLDAQDVQLQDHEARIAGLEQRSPPPAPVDTGAQAAPPAASAVAAPLASKMISGAEVYGRMNARSTGLKAAAPTPSAPAMIQTSTGPILNARAIHDRNNAAVAARAGRGNRG